ncbi:ABC transporter substrate-binding protein [Microbacterium halotolerans]|uniref:ABC transporter substrate-binding protein n=1 Tax=Microbacterium halotolerans TaxID=246613 RepID=UPI000E6ACEBA|nr:ABC transporter substrate-binding protein [Microbacterium halotolerans]
MFDSHSTNPTMPKGRGVRRAAAAASVVAAALVLSACGGEAATNDSEQTLRFGLSAEPAVPIAGMSQGGAVYQMQAMLSSGLMAYDAKGNLQPALAESLEQPDDTTYVFMLREGLVFSDGSPLTVGNVTKTLEYYRDPANGTKVGTGLAGIESISDDGDRTVTVELSEPDSAFLHYLAIPFAGILPDEALTPGAESWVGAGPFELTDFQSGVGATLKKNDDYYDAGAVDLETIEVTFYPDGEARTNALLSGDVDLIEYVPWENFERIEQADGFTLDAQQGPFQYVQFNVTEDRPFADPLVRQAVAFALDRDNAVKAAFQSNGEPLAGLAIAENDPAYDPNLSAMWEQDVEHAKDLLAEAGYPDGFSATMLTTSQYAFLQDTALSVQQDLEAIGIDVTLDAPDWSTRVSKGNGGEYDLAVSGDTGVVADASYLLSWVTGEKTFNVSWGYENAELTDLIDEGLRATDDAAKHDIYQRLAEIWVEEVPIAAIDTRSQAYAYRDGVEGFATLPGMLVFYSGYSIADTSVE